MPSDVSSSLPTRRRTSTGSNNSSELNFIECVTGGNRNPIGVTLTLTLIKKKKPNPSSSRIILAVASSLGIAFDLVKCSKLVVIIPQLTSQCLILGAAAAFDGINFEPTASYPLLDHQRSPTPRWKNGESCWDDRTTTFRNNESDGVQQQQQV